MMKKAAALSRILKTAALLTGCALLFILRRPVCRRGGLLEHTAQ